MLAATLRSILPMLNYLELVYNGNYVGKCELFPGAWIEVFTYGQDIYMAAPDDFICEVTKEEAFLIFA
jgi:hypothetical protein